MGRVVVMHVTTDQLRLSRLMTVAAWCYPVLLIAAIYSTWLIAWGVLGHSPRPSLDDPKQISRWVDLPYYISMALVVGFPAAIFVGIAATIWFGRIKQLRRIVVLGLVLSLLAMWAATILLLRWDPLLVGQWYMD